MKFRKKPVVIEAMQFDGSSHSAAQILMWANPYPLPKFQNMYHDGFEQAIYVKTPEGCMRAGVGDWIIRGVEGEFYPCKPDIFEATYELVD